MKQYVPKKPVRRGFKVWARADAVSGYVSEFDVYTGKVPGEREYGLGGNVVKRLTRNITACSVLGQLFYKRTTISRLAERQSICLWYL